MKDYIEQGQKLRFVFPIDGDVLNEFDGEEHSGRLFINVKVFSTDDSVRINGLVAKKRGDFFTREIALDFGQKKYAFLFLKIPSADTDCRAMTILFVFGI